MEIEITPRQKWCEQIREMYDFVLREGKSSDPRGGTSNRSISAAIRRATS